LEEIKIGEVQFGLVGKFLAKLKRELGRRNNKLEKVVKFKRLNKV